MSMTRTHGLLTVGRRLFLGLLPALLALALVIGLAYYGQYRRQAPGLVVLGAAALAITSLIVTWLNARYLGTRIARLAGSMSAEQTVNAGHGEVDELDRIERVVDHLGSALSASEAERARVDSAAAAHLREQATMLAAVVRRAVAQLDEIRLPIHILLDTRFGDLNENQEELLRDARSAADAMDEALRRLSQVADADRGALPVQRELVQVNDVVRAVLPLAHAAAERRGGRVDASLEPGLPRVLADRARLAEALTLLTREAAGSVGPEQPLTVATARNSGTVTITIAPPIPEAPDDDVSGQRETQRSNGAGSPRDIVDTLLATRLVTVQGGTLEKTPTGTVVRVGGQPRTGA